MADFFEKLKKGMEEEEALEEPIAKEKPKIKKKKKPAVSTSKKRIEIKSEEDSDIEKIPIEQKDDWLDSEGELTVDVYQTDEEIVIQFAIAGIEPEDLDISIEKDMITIRGKREKVHKYSGNSKSLEQWKIEFVKFIKLHKKKLRSF